ncbi:helix-turn-helix domain-containing protein [Microvirga sp. 2TAF3]|uniref:helix-turn-helix domain-containing protein n=1 Tax=Microvirga sp. 2TAF3 TaxID=3233014 RepID=UPI003F9BDDC7
MVFACITIRAVPLDIAASIGPAVRKHREILRLSQEELGDRAGLDRTYIGQVERGRRNPTMVSLQRIAHGLGIELDVLIATARELAAGRS